jgi:hypothetical protein
MNRKSFLGNLSVFVVGAPSIAKALEKTKPQENNYGWPSGHKIRKYDVLLHKEWRQFFHVVDIKDDEFKLRSLDLPEDLIAKEHVVKKWFLPVGREIYK